MSFKLLTYVRHKEQGIQGLVINPSNEKCSHVTVYDPECPNDDENPEDLKIDKSKPIKIVKEESK